MRVQKKVLFLSVFLMIVGFAAVSTTLYLNGTIGIGANQPDFDVYFSKAVEDGVENNTLIQDKTHLVFTTELSQPDEKYILDYDVTNGSHQYDASISINCTGGNDVLRVENNFNVIDDLKAREVRKGKLTLTVIKSVLEETEVDISCEITGHAVERDTTGGETIENEKENYLAVVQESSTPEISDPYLGYVIDRNKIEAINIMDTKDAPAGSTLIGDVSDAQNGSILMYSKDEDSNDMLELYIGQNGGVKANPNSNSLFGIFPNLVSVNGLENLDTSNVTIMSSMFEKCNKLTSLDLSSFDTSKVTDMSCMFDDCSSLTSLNISKFDTSKVTDMEWMFAGCISLPNLDVRHFNTSNVTNMHATFAYCGPTSLDLSTWDTSNVKRMYRMFQNYSNLTSLDVSHFDISNVTNVDEMFDNCSNLTSLDLSSFGKNKITSVYKLFYHCEKLTTLDISNLDTSKVTDMRSMFYWCTNLTSLDLSSFDTSNVEEMYGMFYNCSSLTSLDLRNFDTSNVTTMGSMFKYCSNLTTTFAIRGTKCTSYSEMFSYAATNSGAQITINYTEDASELVDQMIATKSNKSNVIKGSALAKYTITVNTANITSDVVDAYYLTKITLSSTEESKIVASFKVNGKLVKGDTFKMPNENAIITDVETVTGAIIESEHNPYPGGMYNKVYGEKTFEGATSLTVTLDSQTENVSYDWIYLYDSTGKQYGKYGGYARTTETITIPGNYIKIVFSTSTSWNDYYGFKATVVPNYE